MALFDNLIFSKHEQKEALQHAAIYLNPRRFIMAFKEAELTDYQHGNLIGKISLLAEYGYIKWSYSEDRVDEKGEKYYKINSMNLTPEGEKLLKSYRFFSGFSIKSIILGVIIALLAAYIKSKIGAF